MPTIEPGADWKTQLGKGCRLLTIVEEIEAGEYYTADSELRLGGNHR
jgi:hypothetical protein